MEAIGNAQWFERMLAELKQELWIGDAAQIRRLVVREQKIDRRDARHILELLRDGRFPRIWVPCPNLRVRSAPVVALAKRGDVCDVVATVPCVELHVLVESHHAALGMAKPALPVGGCERVQKHYPALV